MAKKLKVLSPLNERPSEAKKAAPRVKNLAGKVLGLLDIRKRQSDVFLDRLEELLKERCKLKGIVRRQKPGEERPAPEALRRELEAECDAMVIALAD